MGPEVFSRTHPHLPGVHTHTYLSCGEWGPGVTGDELSEQEGARGLNSATAYTIGAVINAAGMTAGNCFIAGERLPGMPMCVVGR